MLVIVVKEFKQLLLVRVLDIIYKAREVLLSDTKLDIQGLKQVMYLLVIKRI